MTQRNSILQELTELNSSLAGVEARNPYVVPEGYFEDLLPELMKRIRAMETENAGEEIAALSPLLAGLRKEMPFTVPEGYFEQVFMPEPKAAKIVSLNPRQWFHYAAAVVIIGFLVLAGLLFLRSNDVEKMSVAGIENKISKEIAKMSDVELTEFLQYTDAGLNGEEKATVSSADDVRELLEDIPSSELKDFIEETSDIEAEEVLMN